MGSCASCKKGQRFMILPQGDYLTYPRLTNYHIQSQTGDKSKVTEATTNMPDAFKTSYIEKSLNQFSFKVSGCILPNFDPKGEVEKNCQDNYFILNLENQLILGVFDGHGPTGHHVAEFVVSYMESFFKQLDQTQQDWEQIIINAMESCETSLSSSGIEISTSGTTGVLLVIESDLIHVGSVGDSRSVLATTAQMQNLKIKQSTACEESDLIDSIRKQRQIVEHKELFAYQITQDQKPIDPKEMGRIMKAGGYVDKIKNEQQEGIGPYRVWKPGTQTPGLAMARSIGDSIATGLGVISTPITITLPLTSNDKFIVSGSDGIWDVLSNQEVVNFVQSYKDCCVKGEGQQSSHYVGPGCVNIGQLMAEEARVRWRAIIEAEDVPIDDISCIVVEIIQHNSTKDASADRHTPSILEKN